MSRVLRDNAGMRWTARVVIGVLMLAQLACGLFASVASSDTQRDVFFAKSIADGSLFPLIGPHINNTFHLGPLWYYLLAPPLLVWNNAAAVTAWMGLMSALQFPLAYMLVRRFGCVRDALLVAACLALPGWILVSFGSMTHTILVVPAILAATLAAVRYRELPSLARATCFGLGLVLLATAHPTTVLIALVLAAWAAQRTPRTWRTFGTHALAVLLPPLLALAPMLLAMSGAVGQGDARAIGQYAEDSLGLPSPLRIPVQLFALLAYGPKYVLRFILDAPPGLARTLFAVYVVLLVAAAVGCIDRWRRETASRRPLLCLVALLLAQAWFTCAVRVIQPPWMVYAEWPLVAVLAGVGLSWLAGAGRVAAAGVAAMVGAMLLVTATTYAQYMAAPIDHWEIKPSPGKFGSMDIRDYEKDRYTYRLPRVRFLDLFAIGKPLCARPILYGQYAYLVDYTFGVSAQAACADRSAALLGGRPGDGQQALVGLTATTWTMIGAAPARWVGPIGIVAPSQTWLSEETLAPVLPRLENYSRPMAAEASRFEIAGDASADEWVLVAHRAHRYKPFKIVSVLADGAALTPVYEDSVIALYKTAAGGSARPHWQVTLDAARPYVDVLTFAAPPAPATP